MLIPLSWLKEYVDITLEPKTLAEKLTAIGLSCEKIIKTSDDVILELEITPNRPDLLSIIGVAREVAAIENKQIKYPKFKTNLKRKTNSQTLPLKIHPNFKITPRITGIIINKVKVLPSPDWLKKKLESIGQRSINNLVDITNFVMFELGNPIHSFDYNQIEGKEIYVKQAEGGEEFESVDELKYRLPKGAIIYKDTKKIFDLVGIKGGKNSGTYAGTSAVFIVVEVDDPVLIRKASQKLALRSEASAIFERNVNRGGTLDALKRATDLILDLASGEIASDLIDLKEQDFAPWKLNLNLKRLEFVLGIKIAEKKVLQILTSLNLNPILLSKKNHNTTSITDDEIIQCNIPTFRNDLKIEEDLIEEVARIYGYNNFPKTLPMGEIPISNIPYFRDYSFFAKAKAILIATGFSEIYTYSLISQKDLDKFKILDCDLIKVNNPINSEFEYLRPSLIINLKKAYKQNLPNYKEISLFELGKVYFGKSLAAKQEPYYLSGITNVLNFAQIKGILEKIINDLGIINPDYKIIIEEKTIIFEMKFTKSIKDIKINKIFKPIPKYPAISEDLKLNLNTHIKTGEILNLIKKQSNLIEEVTLLDIYGDTKTFHISYRDEQGNLTNNEVGEIRKKIIQVLEEKFGIKQNNLL